MGSEPAYGTWLTQVWARENAELQKVMPLTQQSLAGQMAEENARLNDVFLAPTLEKVAGMYKFPPLAVCECGVAITGGLHSDWCPLVKENDG